MTTSSPQVCPACQTSNPPQAAFCFGCGQPLGQGTVHPDILHQRYHLLHQLGKGGFGAVQQAEDLQLGNRLVAVKEMNTRNMSAQEISEAEAAFRGEYGLVPCLPRDEKRAATESHATYNNRSRPACLLTRAFFRVILLSRDWYPTR